MAVEHVCEFVEILPHTKGEWAKRRETIKLQPWQSFILACVFGWKRRVDNARRFRIAYCEVSRKNAKSTLLAAIALYLLTADQEAGAEVYSLATTRDQASIVFNTAKQMALKETDLREAFGVEVNAHNLSIEESGSKMQALSADGSVLDGLNIHGAIVDELHAHPTREVWDVVETATGSRVQPLVWTITTAGTNRAGICFEQRSYVCRLLNKTLRAHDGLGYRVEGDVADDETYFGIIYTIDDDDDWTDESVWIKANPNYGISVKPDDMQRLCKKAQQLGSAQPNFLTKRLDVWVNADFAWMDMRAWERAAGPRMTSGEQDIEIGRLVADGWRLIIGLDLAQKLDFTGMAGLLRKGKDFKLFSRHYLPERSIEDSDNSQYLGWAAQGFITECGESEIDTQMIEEDLARWWALGAREIAYDPMAGWAFTQKAINDRGWKMFPVHRQAGHTSEPMREIEAAVVSGRFWHDGNPVMSWMMSNVVANISAKDLLYPRKSNDASKIDTAVASIYAMNRQLVSDARPSVYASRGVLLV